MGVHLMSLDYDPLAVSIVCDERVAMRLTGPDRVEAVRRLTAARVESHEILRLLMWTVDLSILAQYRKRHHIVIPPAVPLGFATPRRRRRSGAASPWRTAS